MLLIAGAAGGATMVLPGVSGSYLLLVLGQYLVILSAISGLKDAIGGEGSMEEPFTILLPVGIGAVIGIVVVSNVMQWFLQHVRITTLGVLMGFLLGAVLGLWPFHAPVQETLLATEYGMSPEQIENLKPRDWPVAGFTPTAGQALSGHWVGGSGLPDLSGHLDAWKGDRLNPFQPCLKALAKADSQAAAKRQASD